jgi:hypothetical protein
LTDAVYFSRIFDPKSLKQIEEEKEGNNGKRRRESPVGKAREDSRDRDERKWYQVKRYGYLLTHSLLIHNLSPLSTLQVL